MAVTNTLTADTHLADTITTLREQVGITVTVHHRPTGTAFDSCEWCDLEDPRPAVVEFAYTLTPNACLHCAPDAARAAIEDAHTDLDADRIHADIDVCESPTVLSELVDDEPGVTVITDADGTRLRIDQVGPEVFLRTDTGRIVARFDLTGTAGIAAAATITAALTTAGRAA